MSENNKVKFWAGIILIVLMLTPFIIKAIRSETVIKTDIVENFYIPEKWDYQQLKS